MSTFTAINLSEDESDIEEHTRELQIEYCFKIFEQALVSQKLKKFKKCGDKYNELFKIDVITAKNSSLHPTIENLKYLAFRNRGFYKLSVLIKELDDKSKLQQSENEKRLIVIEDPPSHKDNVIVQEVDEQVSSIEKTDQEISLSLSPQQEEKVAHLPEDQQKETNSEITKLQQLPKQKHDQEEGVVKLDNFDQPTLLSVDTTIVKKGPGRPTGQKKEDGPTKNFQNNDYKDNKYGSDNDNDDDDDDDDDKEKLELFEKLTSAIDDLVTALEHGEGDFKIIQVLSQIFHNYKLHRLERLSYEYELLNGLDENTHNSVESNQSHNIGNDELKIDLKHPELLLPSQLSLLNGYTSLIDLLHDSVPRSFNSIDQFLNKNKTLKRSLVKRNLNMIKNLKFDKFIDEIEFDKFRSVENDLIQIDVKFTNSQIDLHGLLHGLNDILPKVKGRGKVYDYYLMTDVPIDRIIFKLIENKHSVEIDTKYDDNDSNDIQVSGAVVKMIVLDDDNGDDTNSNTTKDDSEATLAQRLAKRAARGRGEIETIEINTDGFEEERNNFLKVLSQYFKLCNVDIEFPDIPKSVINEGIDNEQLNDSKLKLFLKGLNNWKREHSNSFFVKFNNSDTRMKGSKNDKEKSTPITDILNSSTINVPAEEKIPLVELDSGKLLELVTQLNRKQLHINQVRENILRHLFKLDLTTGGSLLTNGVIDADELRNIRMLVDALDISFFNSFDKLIFSNDENIEDPVLLDKYNISISIVEILIDSYIGVKQEQRLKKINQKSQATELQTIESILFNRVNNWCRVIDDFTLLLEDSEIEEVKEPYNKLWVRYTWATLCFLQHQPKCNTDMISKQLNKMSSMTSEYPMNVLLVNYNGIPRLNKENIDMQVSKMKLLNTFAVGKQSDRILESILVGKNSIDNTAETKADLEMSQFINGSSIDLRLRLWSILFDYYEENNMIDSYHNGFEIVLQIMIDEMNSQSFISFTDNRKTSSILSILGFFELFSDKFCKFLTKSRWNIPLHVSSAKNLTNLIYFFKFIYVFLVHEDYNFLDPTKTSFKQHGKAFDKMVETSILTFTLISVYYNSSLTEKKKEYINDFLSIIHSQLGQRGMCNNDSGYFLEYVETSLADLQWAESDNDFFQLLHCRYGISITLDNYETIEHKCKTSSMSISNAINISKYVVPYCFRKKHPMLSSPRSDIKTIFDKVYEVVGDADPEKDSIVAKNSSVLKGYLENQELDVKQIKYALYGLLSFNMSEPNIPGMEAIKSGLYFMQGLLAIQLFKIRKRVMPGRSAELDFVIKMFEADLICCSNRFETWLLLGQAYSFLVQDDVIWTSDKLNNEEKKKNTALLQRKALLCYMMAANVYAKMNNQKKEELKPIATILWDAFGKELYNASKEPMSKMAFKVSLNNNQMTLDKGTLEKISIRNITPFTDNTINKILEIAFRQACRLNSKEDWLNFMILGKIQRKLNEQGSIQCCFENILKACSIAIKIKKDDPIIEPHYILCSTAYKFAMEDKISITESFNYIKSDSLFASGIIDGDVTNKEEFGKAVICSLRKCISYDKKRWQHKPRYRIAKIFADQFNDIEAAKEEMSPIMNLKPNVRSLTTIWKPENERPGKHFVYNNIYMNFYADLLNKSNDVFSLINLVKKLRRLGSSAVNLSKTFDEVMMKTCIMIKEITGMGPAFLDISITKMVFSDFLKYSKAFVKMMAEKTEFTNHEKLCLLFLVDTAECRKLANGFASTGPVDECYHSLYMVLFLPWVEQEHEREKQEEKRKLQAASVETEIDSEKSHVSKILESVNPTVGSPKSPSTPSREKTKVARRDITPYALQLASNVNSLIESLRNDQAEGKMLPYEVPEISKSNSEPGTKDMLEDITLNLARGKNHRSRDVTPLVPIHHQIIEDDLEIDEIASMIASNLEYELKPEAFSEVESKAEETRKAKRIIEEARKAEEEAKKLKEEEAKKRAEEESTKLEEEAIKSQEMVTEAKEESKEYADESIEDKEGRNEHNKESLKVQTENVGVPVQEKNPVSIDSDTTDTENASSTLENEGGEMGDDDQNKVELGVQENLDADSSEIEEIEEIEVISVKKPRAEEKKEPPQSLLTQFFKPSPKRKVEEVKDIQKSHLENTEMLFSVHKKPKLPSAETIEISEVECLSSDDGGSVFVDANESIRDKNMESLDDHDQKSKVDVDSDISDPKVKYFSLKDLEQDIHGTHNLTERVKEEDDTKIEKPGLQPEEEAEDSMPELLEIDPKSREIMKVKIESVENCEEHNHIAISESKNSVNPVELLNSEKSKSTKRRNPPRGATKSPAYVKRTRLNSGSSSGLLELAKEVNSKRPSRRTRSHTVLELDPEEDNPEDK